MCFVIGRGRDCILSVNCMRWFGAGKTTFVKRHLTGEFEKRYEREYDLNIQTILFTAS